MLLSICTGNQQVTQVSKTKEETPDELTNKMLKCLGRVIQTDGRANVLKQAEGRCDDRFWEIGMFYWSLMVDFHKVDEGKYGRPTDQSRTFLDVRQRVCLAWLPH